MQETRLYQTNSVKIRVLIQRTAITTRKSGQEADTTNLACGRLNIWRYGKLKTEMKIRLYETLVTPILLYGTETRSQT